MGLRSVAGLTSQVGRYKTPPSSFQDAFFSGLHPHTSTKHSTNFFFFSFLLFFFHTLSRLCRSISFFVNFFLCRTGILHFDLSLLGFRPLQNWYSALWYPISTPSSIFLGKQASLYPTKHAVLQHPLWLIRSILDLSSNLLCRPHLSYAVPHLEFPHTCWLHFILPGDPEMVSCFV